MDFSIEHEKGTTVVPVESHYDWGPHVKHIGTLLVPLEIAQNRHAFIRFVARKFQFSETSTLEKFWDSAVKPTVESIRQSQA